MDRRTFFKSLIATGIFAATASVFTGCDSETKVLTAKEVLEKHSNLLSVIDYTQLTYKKGVSVLEELNFARANENKMSIDTIFTLPWYVGPKINLDKNEYFVKAYANESLLFTGFGIGDKVELNYRSSNLFSGKDTVSRANELGFEDIKSLYMYVFDKLTSYTATEVFVMIDLLDQKGILKKEDILNIENINKETKLLIQREFSGYINHEISMATSNKEKSAAKINLPKSKWNLRIENKVVSLKEEDFKIYALTYMICNKIIENTPRGTKVNVF
jgi:hypothetical protein